MARFLVVLVCGILVFVLVWRVAPRFIETYGSYASVEEDDDALEEETAESKAGDKRKAKPVARPRTVGTSRPATRATTTTAAASPVGRDSGGPLSPSTAAKATPMGTADASRRVVQVTSENATSYLTNTSVGPVVGRLTKGAVVEPVFVVNSAGQNWTFVSASNEVAGFMRTDTLSKSKAAEPARP